MLERVRAILLLVLFAYSLSTLTEARAQTVTTEWSVSNGAGLEAGGHVTIAGLPSTVIFGSTQSVDFTFSVERVQGGIHLFPQNIRWSARTSSQQIPLDLSIVYGAFSVGNSFFVRAYWNLFDRPIVNETSAALDFSMAAMIDGQPAQTNAQFAPEPSFILLVLEKTASPENINSTVLWVVSDGGGVEAGGHVVFNGLPRVIRFGQSYRVNTIFMVEWFDWGDHIRPQSIEWYAKAGCLSQTFGVCASNSQNITLGSSVVDGSFASGQTFSLDASWSLADRPVVNGTLAGLGVRIMSLVECLDPTGGMCIPQGAVRPALKFSFLMPESSVSSELLVSTIRVGIDVRPGTDLNLINLKSRGLVPVSILSSPKFDATSTDPFSVRFGETGTEARALRWTFMDTNNDGLVDLRLFFMVQEARFQAGNTEALLTGQNVLGQEISGSDSIRVL